MTERAETHHDPEEGSYAPCRCGCTGHGHAPRWHVRKGPLPLLQKRHGWNVDDNPDLIHAVPRWVDHWWRERLDDGRWRYVAEPYELNDDAFADLAHLVDNGFDVQVAAWRARHYPGHTVAVFITPEVAG